MHSMPPEIVEAASATECIGPGHPWAMAVMPYTQSKRWFCVESTATVAPPQRLGGTTAALKTKNFRRFCPETKKAPGP
jgi:hypothetical protein